MNNASCRRFVAVLLTIVSLVRAAPAAGQDAMQPEKFISGGDDKIPNEYLVVLADDVPSEHAVSVLTQIAAAHGGKVEKVWSSAVKGAFISELTEAKALVLSHLPSVKYIEENAQWYLSAGTQQTNINPVTCDPVSGPCPFADIVEDNRLWHLDRSDQNYASPTNTYSYCTDSPDVTVYVVDGGVQKLHNEFGPTGERVKPGHNATTDLMPADDPCMGFAIPPVPGPNFNLESGLYGQEVLGAGHGTSVASLVGGRRVGIAKDVTIVPVKVIRCDRFSMRARISNRYYQTNETMFRSPDGGLTTGPEYRAQQGGMTLSTDPGGWPTSDDATKVDGGVTWVVVSSSDHQTTTADLVGGLDWIVSGENTEKKSPAIVTLSTFRRGNVVGVPGGSGTVEGAIRTLLAANITVIASANNQNGNACDTSPGRLSQGNPDPSLANDVITVGGSMITNRPWNVPIAGAELEADGPKPDGPNGEKLFYGTEPDYVATQPVRDARWICGAGDSSIQCSNNTPIETPPTSAGSYNGYQGGSNAGPCVTLFAPAKNIFCAIPTSASGYRDARLRGGHASGTSFSAPITAGFAARILQNNQDFTPAQVRAALIANTVASLDPLTLNTRNTFGVEILGTPNRMLQLRDVNITSPPVSTAATFVGTTPLTVAASGTSAVSYKWYEVNNGFDYATYKNGAHSSSPVAANGTSSTYNAPASATTKAYWVRVTNSCGSADSDIAVVVPRPQAPTNARALASGASVNVTWSPASGADAYQVQRKVVGAPWTVAGQVAGGTLAFTETPPSAPGGIVLYRVLTLTGSAYLPPGALAASAPSNADFANVASQTYEAIATTVPVKAQHLIELRQAVNAICDAAEIPAEYSAGDVQTSALLGVSIKAADFTSLLAHINTVRTHSSFGVGTAIFSDVPVVSGAIKGSHVAALRAALE